MAITILVQELWLSLAAVHDMNEMKCTAKYNTKNAKYPFTSNIQI